ncbi:MAG: PQQ-binding-like beta-propeller repeat protein [Lacunisphaera sp.]
MKSCTFSLRVLLLALFTAGPLSASTALWTTQLPADAKWHERTSLGTLMVGTDDALLAINPEDGRILWRRDDFKKTNRHNTREIVGTPVMVANHVEGIGNSKVAFEAFDFLSGEKLWSTPQSIGQYLGTIPAPEKGLVIFVVNTWDAKDNGVHFRAYDLGSGELKWDAKFSKANAIPLHMADNSGSFIPTMDLSGYHDPIIDGDEMYVGYLGIHCVDLTTGAIKWGVEFPPGDKGLKRTYAPLRIEGDRIYGAGGGSVYAIDRHTGATLWKSDRISEYAGLFKARDNAIVSQLEIVGDKVFARYGGNFSNGKQVVLKEPLGIVVLNAANGAAVYNVDKAKEGLTNLMVLPEIHTVMFADAYNLYGLDVASPQLVETFHVPIEFKRKMGGGEVAQIGLGALGGVQGLLKASLSQNKARLDVPVAICRQNGHIVVQGKQHLLGFDPASKSQKWSLYYAAPSDALAMAALFAVTAAQGVVGNAQAAQGSFGSSQYDSGVHTIHSGLDNYNKYAGRRKSATQSSEAYSYILTKVGKSKELGIVGVNLATGETDRELALARRSRTTSSMRCRAASTTLRAAISWWPTNFDRSQAAGGVRPAQAGRGAACIAALAFVPRPVVADFHLGDQRPPKAWPQKHKKRKNRSERGASRPGQAFTRQVKFGRLGNQRI